MTNSTVDMKDLVVRLRVAAEHFEGGVNRDFRLAAELLTAAAVEIERLRAGATK